MQEEIIKELREEFDHIVPSQGGFIVGRKGSKFDNCACDLSYVIDKFEKKLLSAISQAKEEGRRHGVEEGKKLFN